MKSLAYIPGSDGSANASLMTITQVRTAPATSITVNTVAGVPQKFLASMGTPHTFIDPVTGETITVISEASAVDFAGHIDSGKVEIDAIAPGYTDLGSKVGDIIVIRPITEWANNIHNILSEAHDDDGKLKAGAANKALDAPQGFLINGKIVRTVTGNNLTVAIKTLADTDPSASSPVYVRIGNTIRTISAALSVTKNAGTNWFGKGASFFANADTDYFVYLCWNTTDSAVSIGFSSIPNAIQYGNFSTTSTAYNYWAGSGSAPASSDQVENVGRFNATLSATSSFNWSVPATSIIISRPIFETRILSYTNNGNAAGTVYYKQTGDLKELWGLTPNALLNASVVSLTINLPTGFLSTVHSVTAQSANMSGNANIECYIAVVTASTLNVYLAGKAAGNEAGFGFMIKGI